ncbi:hypothetical protein HJC23_001432 [Cyclotella cryptica]|uniref:Chitin-binding type-2 domain-containing protein n=1 Tax=Cyclotella cryptica TaxID=29204 RepID=A0ABD3P3S3_9STRA|eukprot:CCRYP_018669-RA/>CCRYP_018669-RA protein AED:0.07 eAED:0.07 QI:246/1/1/1/0.5/0.33/3/234/553
MTNAITRKNLLSLALLLCSVVAASAQCDPCDLVPNGFTVRPGTGCAEYINCVNGEEANAQTCGGGTLFDLAIVGCNWDYLVTCPPDTECTPTTTTTTAATSAAASVVPAFTSENGNETAVDQDVVPLKFSVYGLSSDADEATLKEEMKGILQMILFELEELEKGSGLKILDVVAWERREKKSRILQSDSVEMMFNIGVLPTEGVNFGPVIVNAIRKRYDSLVNDVLGWTDSGYITSDFQFDVCAHSESSGGYTDCSSDAASDDYYGEGTTMSTTASYGTNPVAVQSSTSSNDGLPTWAIIVIVFVSLLLLACIVAFILFVGCNKSDDYYLEDDLAGGKKRRGYSESESSRSSENSAKEMVVYNEEEAGEYPQRCYVDEEDHNSSILPRSKVGPAPMTSSASVRSSSRASQRSRQSASQLRSSKGKIRGDASGYEVRSHTGSVTSNFSRRSHDRHPDPTVYNIRPNATDPTAYNHNASDPSTYNANATDPSVYNPNATDPEVRSFYSREQFSHQLESLGGNSKASKKSGKQTSVRMDYSVVSELSEPSVTGRYA